MSIVATIENYLGYFGAGEMKVVVANLVYAYARGEPERLDLQRRQAEVPLMTHLCQKGTRMRSGAQVQETVGLLGLVNARCKKNTGLLRDRESGEECCSLG